MSLRIDVPVFFGSENEAKTFSNKKLIFWVKYFFANS
jgi:hypothetical protein